MLIGLTVGKLNYCLFYLSRICSIYFYSYNILAIACLQNDENYTQNLGIKRYSPTPRSTDKFISVIFRKIDSIQPEYIKEDKNKSM